MIQDKKPTGEMAAWFIGVCQKSVTPWHSRDDPHTPPLRHPLQTSRERVLNRSYQQYYLGEIGLAAGSEAIQIMSSDCLINVTTIPALRQLLNHTTSPIGLRAEEAESLSIQTNSRALGI